MNQDAKRILDATLREALPGAAVGQALDQISFQAGGRLILVAAGKAAWEMARAAHERLGERIDAGVVVTKYDHSRGPLGNLEIFEAGHPVPDENSYRATARALEAVSGLTKMTACCSCSPAAARRSLSSRSSPPTSWPTSRASCWPAAPHRGDEHAAQAPLRRQGRPLRTRPALRRMSMPWCSATSSATRWT